MSNSMSQFESELAGLLNFHSKENDSNTPDYILAKYLVACLEAFSSASSAREQWFGTKLEIRKQREQNYQTILKRSDAIKRGEDEQ